MKDRIKDKRNKQNMIINTPDLNQVRNHIQKIKKSNQSEPIIVKAQDEEFNRKVLEIKGVNILLSPELHSRKDKQKQRDSGLNEFLCKLAAKNNIKIGIDIDEIKKLDKKQRSFAIARIMQNIMLCKKAKCDIIIFPKNKYNKLDLMAFMLSLKASTSQSKKAAE